MHRPALIFHQQRRELLDDGTRRYFSGPGWAPVWHDREGAELQTHAISEN